ncbi:MAG: hypothetical protein JW839_21905 [Candidatus Lokiarchaeota archaeon]|nr:hypothetical protein [Candidatus Lokiarchaeota archaeon]
MEEKPPEFTDNAPKTVDVHLVNYGIILNQEIIFMSNEQFEPLLQVVNYTNSFAMNIHDGRLYKIKHELDGKPYTTLVQARVVNEKTLMYVISGSDEKLPPRFQQQILDNFTKEIEDAVPIKRVEKFYQDKLDDFTRRLHRAADKVDQGISLIHDMQDSDDDFLVTEADYSLTRIHYIGISTAGVPVRNRLYGKELVTMFKIPQNEHLPPDEIVRSLISAQFSAIINSSLIQAGTRITEITINYTNIESMEPTQLKIAFFPIGFQKQFTLEVCFQGKREEVDGFMIACQPMLDKYLHVQFRGNLKDFELVADVLAILPDKFDLFGQMPDEFAQPSDHIDEEQPEGNPEPEEGAKQADFDVNNITLNFSDDPDDEN